MIIRKEYDIKSLIEQLESDLNVSQQYNTTKVKVNNLVIQDIIDVLKETLKREQKHQTLESMCHFIEKEDETQTNEFEMYNNQQEKTDDIIKNTDDEKPKCFGMFFRNQDGTNRPFCRSKSCEYRIECVVQGDI